MDAPDYPLPEPRSIGLLDEGPCGGPGNDQTCEDQAGIALGYAKCNQQHGHEECKLGPKRIWPPVKGLKVRNYLLSVQSVPRPWRSAQ